MQVVIALQFNETHLSVSRTAVTISIQFFPSATHSQDHPFYRGVDLPDKRL